MLATIVQIECVEGTGSNSHAGTIPVGLHAPLSAELHTKSTTPFKNIQSSPSSIKFGRQTVVKDSGCLFVRLRCGCTVASLKES